MALTNPSRALGPFLLLLTSLIISTLTGIPLFSTNLFQRAFLLAFLSDRHTLCFFKVTKVGHFKSIKVFCKDQFLSMYFSIFSCIIFLVLCLPSVVLLMLKSSPFAYPPPFGHCCNGSYTRSSHWTGAVV